MTRPDPSPRPLRPTDPLPVAVADDGVFKLLTTPQRTRRRVKFADGLAVSASVGELSSHSIYQNLNAIHYFSSYRGLGLCRSKPAGHGHHTTPRILVGVVWVLKQATADYIAHSYDSFHPKDVLYGATRPSQFGIALKHSSVPAPARPWPEPIITNPLGGCLHSSLIFVPRYSKPF